ncbi:SDR family oxidoreductase [Dysgonomonas macrotermitis]|uniref:3-oxoacyl-[acyl-carrier protein] reductase n=1 Tax=Dysgonomonas macrotermitis TaxID=1346286 RepID=A0A1M5HF30_9BACT|nr:SDR family oxidoreductase [Dysgonomonas macrotermitis]SHG14553.1 3-oxoacyl-[acyl-carrier protein] reductase [Dysgonomonas macrotermitis]
MNIYLSGKRVLVCGGSQGIGFASAQLFARSGASVTLVARSKESLETAVKELYVGADNQVHDYLELDLADPYKATNELSVYIGGGKNIDILINNSGGPAPAGLLGEKPEKFLSYFSQHIITAQLFTQLVVPHMKQEKWGRIVNIISTSVKVPIAGLGVSNTIRGAMASWSKTMAGELAPFGITVNNVLPGSTDTQRIASIIATDAQKTGKSEDEVRALREASIPMKRIGKPEEVAAGIVFLASREASYITGVNLPVDGGSTPSM